MKAVVVVVAVVGTYVVVSRVARYLMIRKVMGDFEEAFNRQNGFHA